MGKIYTRTVNHFYNEFEGLVIDEFEVGIISLNGLTLIIDLPTGYIINLMPDLKYANSYTTEAMKNDIEKFRASTRRYEAAVNDLAFFINATQK